MKVSEVTIQDLKDYCRAEDDEENVLFSAILGAAKQFIKTQTGLDEAGMETKEDLAIVVLIIGAEMYENRTYTMSSNRTVNINPAAEAIIDQYRMNLL
ncbi:head-tail connector protein [Anaerotignum sp. MB30-C6]|uniref:head-tail connector protein n=1 Tax=Anaerotignum sp. MB30-C6 TaxID=3070814 RepID=UPI0027DD0BEB|nr:head-tail connector protein [Anaerotignum sp. MB30-C6]WMI81593.1 head-tail connector protein [Anaerotignum sp. MB30-C6]